MKINKYDNRIQFKCSSQTKADFDKACAELYNKEMSEYLREIVENVIQQHKTKAGEVNGILS